MNPGSSAESLSVAPVKKAMKKREALGFAKRLFGPRARVGYDAAAGNRWVAIRQRIGYKLLAVGKTYDAIFKAILKEGVK